MRWLEPVSANLPLERIYDREFSNQVIVVDGKDFIDCTFTNITFRYKGGYYEFENAKFTGSIGVDTDQDVAENAFNLLVWLDSHTQNHALVTHWRKFSPKHFM